MTYVKRNERIYVIIKKLLNRNAKGQIKKIAQKYHPSDLAEILVRLVPEDQIKFINILFELNLAGKTLSEVDEPELRRILPLVDNNKLAEMCERVESDDAVDFLGLLPEDRAAEILAIIKGHKKEEYEELLAYDEDSAGGIMSTDFFALNENMTVKDTIAEIKKFPQKETVFYLYIVNEFQKLVGVISLRSLLLQDENTELKDFMTTNIIFVEVDNTQEEVAEIISKYDLLAIPVVNEEHKLVGVINVDDVIDVIEESVAEDLYHLSGVDIDENINTGLFKSYKFRVPWLVINFGTAILASLVVRYFSGVIEKNVIIASLLPIIAGMGGNGGSQVLTIMVRSLALMETHMFSIWKITLKEAGVGMLNGITNGLILAAMVLLIDGNFILALSGFLAMTINLTIAGIGGATIPILLKKLHFDPAVSSAIFLTTLTDLSGFFSMLGLYSLLSK